MESVASRASDMLIYNRPYIILVATGDRAYVNLHPCCVLPCWDVYLYTCLSILVGYVWHHVVAVYLYRHTCRLYMIAMWHHVLDVYLSGCIGILVGYMWHHVVDVYLSACHVELHVGDTHTVTVRLPVVINPVDPITRQYSQLWCGDKLKQQYLIT